LRDHEKASSFKGPVGEGSNDKAATEMIGCSHWSLSKAKYLIAIPRNLGWRKRQLSCHQI